jgi:hypothetical protein
MTTKQLARILHQGPLTKTVRRAESATTDQIHAAAAVLGYTRAAVNHALRVCGRVQRPWRVKGPSQTP